MVASCSPRRKRWPALHLEPDGWRGGGRCGTGPDHSHRCRRDRGRRDGDGRRRIRVGQLPGGLENADIERERREHLADPEYERRELVAIYVDRGLPHPLAEQVADALSENGALEAHLRDELGISDHSIARPAQAAIASAASFVTGGIVPLLTVLLVAEASAIWAISAVAIFALALLGAAGAKAGGAPLAAAIVRVVLFGSLAMATTAGVGRIFHVAAG